MHQEDVSETARAILDYLRRNPEAQDTLEGIVQWWLPKQQVQPRLATIKEALQELVSAGLISEHKGKDGQVSYRMIDPTVRKQDRHT